MRPAKSISRKKSHILVADDHPLFREGLVQLINRERDLCCCGETDSVIATQTAVLTLKPDLLVLDLQRLTFIDSSGLRFILESDLRARKESRRVAIVPGPEQVHRIFLIALLDMRLDFIEPDQMETTS